MNEIMNVMKERRSIRKFKPDMPSKEDFKPDHRGWSVCSKRYGKAGSDHCCCYQ